MNCCRLLPQSFVTGVLLVAGLSVVADAAGQVQAEKGRDPVVQIRFDGQGKERADEQRFVVTGLRSATLRRLATAAADNPDVWFDTMIVTVASETPAKPRPMLGDYSIDEASLVFAPRYPLRHGTTYRVEVVTGAERGQLPISRDFKLANRSSSPPASLLAVYPTTGMLPENQLKFYLQFSSPMSRGEAYHCVKLLDQRGKQVEFPFLELGEELWDPSGTRFTLFFDPGRIKRGLKPRELFGPALVEGRSYTLVVEQQWRDARGRPLKAAHHKRFKVVAPDDKQPTPSDWELVTPAAASRQPLVVSFGEPLDHAMLQRVVTVTRGGAAVPGRIVISKQESQWSFSPAADWAAGEYALAVDAALEDLAGNSIGRPFEVDVFDEVERTPRGAAIRVPFEIRP